MIKMEKIEKVHREKIDLEISSLLYRYSSQDISLKEILEELEGDIIYQEAKQRIKQSKQVISKKREIELYLEEISKYLNVVIDNITSFLCAQCIYYPGPLAFLLRPKKEVFCKKGHKASFEGIDKIICTDYTGDKKDEKTEYERTQNTIKLLTQLKQQKQAELEQYQERKQQIHLERRLT